MSKVLEQRMLFKKDPIFMGQALLPSMFKVAPAQFHVDIVEDYLDKKHDRYCYIAPRGFAKSSIVAGLLVLHHIFFSKHNQKVILLVSKTEGHAIALLDTLKNILSGQDGDGLFATFFGVHDKHNARKWGAKQIELKDRTTIIARGTGQQIVGMKKDSQRPTLIIFDDPEDMSNTRTAEAMEFNLRWLLNGVMPARDPQGKVIVIGTPQHELCMVETLMKTKGWKSRRWQAINGEGWENDYSLGTSLWPEQHSMASLVTEYESTMSIGRVSSFYREYQCVVVGDGDRKFTSNMIRYCNIESCKRVDGIHMLKGRYMEYDPGTKEYKTGQRFEFSVTIQIGIDLASTIGQRSDFTVIFTWALTQCRKLFVLSYDRYKEPPLQNVTKIKKRLDEVDPDYVYIEQQGFQVMVRDVLRKQMNVNYAGMGIKITYSDSKEDRIFLKLQPHYAQKHVYHVVRKDENLCRELFMFPRGATDDIIDAGSTGLWRLNWPEYAHHVQETQNFNNNTNVEDESWMTA